MIRNITYSCLLFLLDVQLNGQETPGGLINENRRPMALTVEQYKAKTNVKDKLVLVNFSADWCVVCKRQKPILDEIYAENKERLEMIELDMEHNPLIAEYFEVDGLPVNILYRKGEMVWNRMGFMNKKQLMELIKSYEEKPRSK
jgi:thioredoxin 1